MPELTKEQIAERVAQREQLERDMLTVAVEEIAKAGAWTAEELENADNDYAKALPVLRAFLAIRKIEERSNWQGSVDFLHIICSAIWQVKTSAELHNEVRAEPYSLGGAEYLAIYKALSLVSRLDSICDSLAEALSYEEDPTMTLGSVMAVFLQKKVSNDG